MKTVRFYSAILLGLFAAAAFTSCIDDDNDNGTKATVLETDEQRANALSHMTGMYNGNLYYYSASAAQNTASTALIWAINSDGTFTANNFPVQVLANYVNDPQAKALVAAVGMQRITGKVTPYATFSTYYQSSFEPDNTANQWNVTLEGSEEGEESEVHTVGLQLAQSFSYNNTTSYTVFAYETTSRVLQGTLLLDKFVIDGKVYDLKSQLAIQGTR